MRIVLLKHFEFDDESTIAAWAERKEYPITIITPPEGDQWPPHDEYEMLIILGGPMSAYQEVEYSWLIEEKAYIHEAIVKDRKVLGICLGAQLLAEVLGSTVYRNEQKEIGWHPVTRTEHSHILFEGIASSFYSFHWHGDCFNLPKGAVPLAFSEATRCQAFAYHDHVLALQFHLETTPACIHTMLSTWKQELVAAPYIQRSEIIKEQLWRHDDSTKLLHQLLDQLSYS
ncbi:MAG: type 1 glutamine amidotransferase [Candidatus Pristimantibacillus sp.]